MKPSIILRVNRAPQYLCHYILLVLLHMLGKWGPIPKDYMYAVIYPNAFRIKEIRVAMHFVQHSWAPVHM